MLRELAETAIIDKTRYRVRHADHLWEVDEFAGDNAGLIVAEIELQAEDEPFERPSWLGAEVSDDPRYYNANLARHPFKDW
jgi:adenylate cyclase